MFITSSSIMNQEEWDHFVSENQELNLKAARKSRKNALVRNLNAAISGTLVPYSRKSANICGIQVFNGQVEKIRTNNDKTDYSVLLTNDLSLR